LFAGHMTGAAVGGMLASQVGQQPVFVVGAIMVVAAALALRILLWPYRATPTRAAPASATTPSPTAPAPAVTPTPALHTLAVRSPGAAGGMRLGSLLADRGYAALLAGSVVPFSIAQVGLLSYALPLYFDAEGATTADVGRVIMLYGFCVIYLGPVLGGATDRSRHWKLWISAGGVVGAVGLLTLHWAPGLVGVTAAVLLLAVAS